MISNYEIENEENEVIETLADLSSNELKSIIKYLLISADETDKELDDSFIDLF